MAQFDVFRLADGELALDVQTDLLSGFHTRVVIPLVPAGEALVAHPRLNPVFRIAGSDYMLATQSIVALETREVGKVVANLDDHYDAIRSALDMIFLGF
jgi:toxin CcdB